MTEQRTGPADPLAALGYDEETVDAVKDLAYASADPMDTLERLVPILAADPELAFDQTVLGRLVALVASSRALSQSLAAHPEILTTTPTDSIPLQVRARLAQIASEDLSGAIDFTEATRRYSVALDEIVDSALDRSRHAIADRHPIALELPFSVIAMGKWGAGEVNYYSDIDLLFVHQAPGGRDDEARSAALALASRLIASLSAPTFDGPALIVDADLRPEGKMGPLSVSYTHLTLPTIYSV